MTTTEFNRRWAAVCDIISVKLEYDFICICEIKFGRGSSYARTTVYELSCCPNLARQNEWILSCLPHSLFRTAHSVCLPLYRGIRKYAPNCI